MDLQKIRNITSIITASHVSLCVPTEFWGRGALRVTLGVSSLLFLLFSNHKQNLTQIFPYISRNMTAFLTVLMLSSAINIFVSISPTLSFETSVRTWVLVIAIGYIIFSLRQHLQLMLGLLSCATIIVLNLHLISAIELSKPNINAYLLAMPLIGLWFHKCFQIGFFVFPLGFFLYVSDLVQLKAALADALLTLLVALSLFSTKRFTVTMTFLIFTAGSLICASAALCFETNLMNETSLAHGDYTDVPAYLIHIHRQIIWAFSFDLWQQNPILGIGPNASPPLLPSKALENIWGPTLKTYPMWTIGGTGLLNFSFWSAWWQFSYFTCAAISLSVFLVTKDEY